MPGPPPKRSEQRRRNVEPATGTPRKATRGTDRDAPDALEGWHPLARHWYESLARSGQHVFYEPSDWATAMVVAESMSRELLPRTIVLKDGGTIELECSPSGATVTAWLKAMGSLVVTEGDRRRAAIELVDGISEEAGDVSWIDDARRRLRESG